MKPFTRTVAVLSLAAVGGATLAASAPPAQAKVALEAPSFGASWSARVLAPVTARVHPRRGAPAVTVLQPVAPLGKGPTWLLVAGARTVKGQRWVRLVLPVRPNEVKGWVPANLVRFRRSTLRVVIDQTDRELTLFRAGKAILRTPIAIGEAITPTPNGNFAIAEMIRTWTPGAFLGPVVFPLTGYSRTLNEYAGGDGRVAIHGTSRPELIGTRASHGCIRVPNRSIVKLSKLVRPGTPVVIRT